MENKQNTLDALIRIVDQIASGEKPEKIAADAIQPSGNDQLDELSAKLQSLNNQYSDSYEFITDLSRGKLSTMLPQRNPFANPYKQLHSELRYLTWQIQQIADGDYNQRVYFSGEFSYAINKMILSLREQGGLIKQLENCNATKQKLLSIISHDLRNPFNAIMGFCEVMKEAVEKQDLKEIKNCAERIHISAIRTYDLLMNLLEWSRVQGESIVCTPREVDLRLAILANIRLVSAATAIKNITVRFNNTEGFPARVDNSMLNTVLRNLLSNAVKYTPDGGQINVAVQKSDEFYYISIQDSGMGMSDDTVRQITQFHSIHSIPGTNSEPGTGIGLVLCYDFVEMMGGKIIIESKLGEGTTFTFSIPAIS